MTVTLKPSSKHLTKAKIMAKGNGLGKGSVKAEGRGNGSCYLGDFENVCQASSIVITSRCQKHLGLVF